MSESTEAKGENLEPIEIHFGDEFIWIFEGEKYNYVITELGENGWFGSARVGKTETGRERLGLGGTSYRENIHEMTGNRWTLGRILQAYKNWSSDEGFDFGDKFYEFFREYSKASPRVIS